MKRKSTHENGNSSSKSHPKTKKFKAQPKKEKQFKLVQPNLPKSAGELSSNWLALKQVLCKEKIDSKEASSYSKSKKFKRFSSKKKDEIKASNADNSKSLEDEIWFDDVDIDDIERSRGSKAGPSNQASEMTTSSRQADLSLGGFTGLTKRIAIDCEFVGVGLNGKRNMLARVSVINSHCTPVYDKFVAPQEKVTDYRTGVSGIRPHDLKNATDFKTVQNEVSDMLKGRILIGHAVKNDLKVLLLDHPKKDTRDTAKYKPFRNIVKSNNPSLKKLSQEILHTKIQEGEHSSVQDAQAAMRLYILHKKQWEKQIKEKKLKPKSKIVDDDDDGDS